MMVILFPTLLLLAVVRGQGPPSGGQECALLITSPIYVCEDDVSKSYINCDGIEIVRPNETTTFVTGMIKLLKEFDPATKLEIMVLKIANNKKEMMLSIEMNLCEEMAKGEESDFYKLLQYMGLPASCPIEPGEYPINNLVADMDDLPINNGNIGDYVTLLNFFKCNDDECKDKTMEGCAMLDCVIEPV